MSFTTTTLTGAVAIDQNTIAVTSATGFLAGGLVKVDDEIMEIAADYASGLNISVLRGREGTATSAHPTAARVTVGAVTDWASGHPAVSVTYPVAGRGRQVRSYSAAGALDHPLAGNDAVAILNGTSVRAMTLAHPANDIDGSELIIIGNGKAAHTVTVATGGVGNAGAGYTILTFAAGANVGVRFIAAGGFWVAPGAPGYAGTATALLATIT